MTRIEEGKVVVEQMIRLYCYKKEGNEHLCPHCQELLNYAHNRLSKCVFGNEKGTCKKCAIHCYKSDMKQQIKTIMAWAGPRMLLYHPLSAIKHLLREM